MSEFIPETIGWKVLDSGGNIVQQGEGTIISVDVLEEITQRLDELAAESEGEK